VCRQLPQIESHFVEIDDNLRSCEPAHTTDASAGVIWSSRDGCRRAVAGGYSGCDGETAETIQISNFDKGVTNMRQALGPLISAMNPYSNPACQAVDDDVAGRMQPFGLPLPQGVAADGLPALVARINVEIDNYHGEWSFMGQMYKIRRALLIPYRYEVRNSDGVASGVWAAGSLLIGYTGGNGGG
jgi:hypothetical protein